jgi:hypothetical protein
MPASPHQVHSVTETRPNLQEEATALVNRWRCDLFAPSIVFSPACRLVPHFGQYPTLSLIDRESRALPRTTANTSLRRNPMRFAFISLVLLTVGGCSSQQAFDSSGCLWTETRRIRRQRWVWRNHSERRQSRPSRPMSHKRDTGCWLPAFRTAVN